MNDIFAVYDVVAERYLQPFFGENPGSAIRGFATVCGEPDHQFAIHPSDYSLFHIGTWDELKGEITPLEPRQIASAASFSAAPSVRGPVVDESNGAIREVDQVHMEGRR